METRPCSPACPGQVEEIMLWMRLIDSLADCPSPELPSGCVSAGCNTLSGVCGTWWQRLVLVPKSSIRSSKCLALRYAQLLWKRDACCCSSALFWCLPSHPCTACSLQHHLSEFYSLEEERFWFACRKKATLVQSALKTEKRRLGQCWHRSPGKLQPGCSLCSWYPQTQPDPTPLLHQSFSQVKRAALTLCCKQLHACPAATLVNG